MVVLEVFVLSDRGDDLLFLDVFAPFLDLLVHLVQKLRIVALFLLLSLS